jgi:alkylation response protein AidB-like acyl-CoA dehydrogenase
LAGEALALAVAYVRQRHQFGRPIGSFQALAHGLVDVATAVDGARLLAFEAAWALDAGAADRALASMAFAFAADTAAKTTACALHCHGGYGFMAEYDVQLYHRRAKSWAIVHDSVRGELAHLASMLWGA